MSTSAEQHEIPWICASLEARRKRFFGYQRLSGIIRENRRKGSNRQARGRASLGRLRSPLRDGRPAESAHRLERVEVDAVAHILLRGVAERLKIPGADVPLGQGGVDEPAAPLALAHGRVEPRQIPAAGDLGAEFGDLTGMLGQRRQIAALARIPGDVVELVGIGRRMDEFEPPRRIMTTARSPPRPDIRRSPRRGRRARQDAASGSVAVGVIPARRPRDRRGSEEGRRARRSPRRGAARNGRGSTRRAARGRRPRRSSSCTRGRARPASRRGR